MNTEKWLLMKAFASYQGIFANQSIQLDEFGRAMNNIFVP